MFIASAISFDIINHNTNEIIDITNTTGTKYPLILSAILAIGAFVAAASFTIWIICDKVVSSPTLVASQRRKPV